MKFFKFLTLAAVSITAVLGTSGCNKNREVGNTLRFAVREKFKSLDPAHGQDHYSNILIRRTYEGLLKYHYLKRPYEVVPHLAEAMPVVSKDKLTYTFKIKKGVRFHDDKAFEATGGKGRELTAADFIFSFKRIADPKVISDGWWIFDGRVAGLNEWRESASKTGKADYGAAVEGLKAIDSHTLQIKLTKPNPLILHVLTMPYTNVVAQEVVKFHGAEFGTHPVGTGPYMLQSLSSNQAIWVKNPNYTHETYPTDGSPGDQEAGRLADAGKQLPFVDKIIDDIIIEDQPAWLNFMQGNHDYMMKMTKDNVNQILDSEGKPSKDMRDKNIQVLYEPGTWFNYITFNQEDPHIGGEKNKWLRQAMSLAYDEAPTIKMFYFGLAQKAESPIPPGVAGFDPAYKNPYRQYNLAKAREILAKHGHPNGEGLPEFVYDSKGDSTQRQLGEYFIRQMGQLGIKVRLNSVTWPELLARLKKKQAQMTGLSWVYDYPDAENGLQLLYGPNESPGPNNSNYKNKKFDALYEKTATMEDSAERRKLLRQMVDVAAEDVPWMLTVHQAETRLAQPWVKNFKLHVFDHNIEKYLRLDTAARDQALK